MKKIIVSLVLLLLAVWLVPQTSMAVQTIAEITETNEQTDDMEDGQPSEQALRVRERIELARQWQMPPGQLKLIQRYCERTGETCEKMVESYKAGDVRIRDLAREHQVKETKAERPENNGLSKGRNQSDKTNRGLAHGRKKNGSG